MQRMVKGEVIASTFDEPPERHLRDYAIIRGNQAPEPLFTRPEQMVLGAGVLAPRRFKWRRCRAGLHSLAPFRCPLNETMLQMTRSALPGAISGGARMLECQLLRSASSLG